MKIIEIIKEQQGKGYGSLKLTQSSSKQIKQLLKELGINGGINDLHITTIYDVSNPKINVKTNGTKQFHAKVVDVKMLGEPGTKWYAIALTLDSPEIVDLHKKYIDAGFKHSYPNFIAHLSLKYKPSDQDIKTIKDSFDKFKELYLLFSNETLEVIKG